MVENDPLGRVWETLDPKHLSNVLDFLPAVISAKGREKCTGFLKGVVVAVILHELEIKSCLSLCLWQVKMNYREKE